MQRDQQRKNPEYWKQRGMMLGLLVGAAIGFPIGLLSGNVALALIFGAGAAVSVGNGIGQNLMKKYTGDSSEAVSTPREKSTLYGVLILGVIILGSGIAAYLIML